jgi:WD40 repeat protein
MGECAEVKNNPFIGPRPYQRTDRANFYGRTREARDLLSLILAERVVLFYAQSGAGKTSLLNTQIIPALEDDGFQVLANIRVGSDLPPGLDARSVKNIFVFSTGMGLTASAASETYTGSTLTSFLQNAIVAGTESAETRPPVLILDQFEEILTTHRDRWQDARGFFEQLAEALHVLPKLGVVLTLREDHVAGLDPYASLLPRRLRTRYRLEQLGAAGALEAVKQPALKAGVPFASGVAEKLVDDLRRIRIAQSELLDRSAAEVILGPYVEPVQLQVVCSQLWANLPNEDTSIEWSDVEKYGNINKALTGFYESTLDQVRHETSIPEHQLRQWFSTELITPMQTRGLALRGESETANLPNAAVDGLEERHLIRADVRAGARWYELSHDRLVEPIVRSNEQWAAARMTPLRAAAQHWSQTGKDPALLYRDKILREAQAWAKANPAEVEETEAEFLKASDQEQRARARSQRLRLITIVALTIGMLVMAVLAVIAYSSYGAAKTAEEAAKISEATAKTAEAAAVNAQREGRATVWAANGRLAFDTNPLLGMRLALESSAVLLGSNTTGRDFVDQIVRELVATGRRQILSDNVSFFYTAGDETQAYFILQHTDQPGELYRTADASLVVTLTDRVVDASFSPAAGGSYFIVYYANGTAELRHTTDGSIVYPFTGTSTGDESRPAFSGEASSKYFVVYYADQSIEVRTTAENALVSDRLGGVSSVNFSSDEAASYLMVRAPGGAEGLFSWKADTQQYQQVDFPGDQRPISINFSPDPHAEYFAVNYINAWSELWSFSSGEPVQFFDGAYGLGISPDPAAKYLLLYFEGNKPPELRLRADNSAVKLVHALTKNSQVIFSTDPAQTFFEVKTPDGSAELYRSADASPVSLPQSAANIIFMVNPANKYFMVVYQDKTSDLRRIADGSLVADFPDGNYDAFSISPDPQQSYFILTSSRTGSTELWSLQGSPQALGYLEPNTDAGAFDVATQRLVTHYANSYVDVIDLNVLNALNDQAATLPIDAVTRIACQYLFASGQFDLTQLDAYLQGDQPQACPAPP